MPIPESIRDLVALIEGGGGLLLLAAMLYRVERRVFSLELTLRSIMKAHPDA